MNKQKRPIRKMLYIKYSEEVDEAELVYKNIMCSTFVEEKLCIFQSSEEWK